jgi:hypothetical protein
MNVPMQSESILQQNLWTRIFCSLYWNYSKYGNIAARNADFIGILTGLYMDLDWITEPINLVTHNYENLWEHVSHTNSIKCKSSLWKESYYHTSSQEGW